jgi:hypothetical protein
MESEDDRKDQKFSKCEVVEEKDGGQNEAAKSPSEIETEVLETVEKSDADKSSLTRCHESYDLTSLVTHHELEVECQASSTSAQLFRAGGSDGENDDHTAREDHEDLEVLQLENTIIDDDEEEEEEEDNLEKLDDEGNKDPSLEATQSLESKNLDIFGMESFADDGTRKFSYSDAKPLPEEELELACYSPMCVCNESGNCYSVTCKNYKKCSEEEIWKPGETNSEFDEIKVEKAVSVEIEEEVVHQEIHQSSSLQAATTEYIDYDEAIPNNAIQVKLEDLLVELQQIKSELSDEKECHEQTKIALEQEKNKVYAAELDLDHERIELQEEKDNYSSVLVELSKEKKQKQQIKNEIGWNEQETLSKSY